MTGADTDNRMLFEIRVVGDEWYFDSHYQSGAAFKTLMNKEARASLWEPGITSRRCTTARNSATM